MSESLEVNNLDATETMPGETEVEIENGTNGTQEVEPEVKQEEAPPEVKQEETVPVIKQEETVPVIKQEEIVPEVEQEETVPKVKQEEIVPEVKKVETVPEIKQEIVPEIKEEAPIEPAIQQNGAPKKNNKSTSMDTDSVRAAYDDVRSDSTETQWAVFKFEGPRIVSSAKGSSFDKFKQQFSENERAFGYLRIQTGDEMSKRQKFLFITWVGQSVSVLQRAKMSTDKAVVKSVLSNFAVELQLENPSEIDLDFFIEELNKAGGANYGTGVREI